MSRITSYPLASFSKALDLAKAVDSLGDNCASDVCASKMGKKMSGGFKDLVASAVKYGFIINKKGKLTLTDTYNKDYKLSYNDEEANKHLQRLFLKPQLFQEVYDKYKVVGLPVDVLDKALVREFGVPEKYATRTSTYFINGAKFVKLLNEDNTFASIAGSNLQTSSQGQEETPGAVVVDKQEQPVFADVYSIKILGPGVDTTISLTEESDFEIIDAVLKKVKNKVSIKKDGHDAHKTSESSG